MEIIEKEINQLSEQFCVKSLENKALCETLANQTKIIAAYKDQVESISSR